VLAELERVADLLGQHRDLDVGLDAPALNAGAAVDQAPAGQLVVLRRELERRDALSQVVDVLHAALAVGVGADDDRLDAAALRVVLEHARDDLGRAGGALVDEHGDGHVRERREPATGDLTVGLEALRVVLGDDHAVVDEAVGDANGLREQPARVEAQVEDEALEPLRLHRADGRVEVARGVLGELGEPDVADAGVGVDEPVPVALVRTVALPALDGVDRDLRADEGELEQVVVALAFNAEDNLRPGGAGDAVDGLEEGDAERGVVVDLADDVAALNASALGGGALDGRDDLEVARLVELDLDADALERALRGAHELLHVEGPDDGRELVEREHGAVAEGLEHGLLGEVYRRGVGLQDVRDGSPQFELTGVGAVVEPTRFGR